MKKIFLSLILLLFSTVFLYSDIFYVDDDGGPDIFTSIQDGFDSPLTEHGDTLYVYYGTDYGPLNIGNKGLFVIARENDIEISDDDTDTSCIYFSCGCNFFTYFYGFKITGGNSTYGGGVRTIANCDRAIEFDNCEISNNNATYGGGLYLNGSVNARLLLFLVNSTISDNSADKGGGIKCDPHVNLQMYNVIIKDNAADYGGGLCSCGLDCTNELNLLFYGNSAVYNGGAIFMGGEDSNNYQDDFEFNKITIVNNESDYGIGGIYIEHEDGVDLQIRNGIIYYNDGREVPEGNDLTYCCIQDYYAGTGNIFDEPEFKDTSNDDYTLNYISPCIDAGIRSSTYDDEDGSIADMGYVYHEQYKYEWSEFSMGGQSYRLPWKWLSFPRLPVDPEDQYNEGQNVNASEIRWHWNDTPDSCAWYYHGGSATPWFYGLDQDSDEYFDYWSGNDPCTDSLSSLKGYKIYAPESGCSLFTRGKKCEDDTEISTLKNYDTWIGYFILDTQTAEDAFPDSLLDYCTKIQTQRWCTSRATTNDPWSKDLDDCYLNYTDMVVLFTTTGCDFSWNSSRDNTEPVIRPYAEHFDWEEEIDYLPVYVEFDPQDIPNEIGVYVGGECQGAEVVDDLICQICSYILFEEPGQEIEFEFWYEGRGERERKDCYQIHENGFPVTSNTLFTGQPGDFYTLSFNKDDPLEPVPYNFCCYPNPFNPETTISFSLLQESEVELAVYNIKGQRTKTLVDETFRPDTYNIIWQADNDKGNKVSSGVYFIKLKIGKEILTEKVILLK